MRSVDLRRLSEGKIAPPTCPRVRAWRFSGTDLWLQVSRVPRDGVARPAREGYADRLHGTLVFWTLKPFRV